MEQTLDYNFITAIALGILGLVLIVLWVALPFAVFRIKQRLDETNRHLETIMRYSHLLEGHKQDCMNQMNGLTSNKKADGDKMVTFPKSDFATTS